jgi:acyl phosphate:glycerol-3-phosphate acyltransferase
VLAYLIGAVPIGVLIARARGVDIRREGSGNIGASNVMRVLGVKLGLLAFAGDVGKGALAVLLGRWLFGLNAWPLAGCAVAVVVGHCYSPYIGFAGGKAVATGLGVILALNWPAGLVCFAVWIVVVAATRYISVASVVAYALSPAIAWAFRCHVSTVAMAGFLACVSIYRHRDNLRRLLAGTESKIGQRVRAEGGPTE